MQKWLITILLLMTVDQVKSKECSIGCKFIAYHGGYYKDTNCYCVDIKPYDSMITKPKPQEIRKTTKGDRGSYQPNY